jgi:hypothetical protein
MLRFFVLFAMILVLTLSVMAGVLAQYGYSFLDPEMRIMALLGLVIAAYVAWRIGGILQRRENSLNAYDRPEGGAGRSKLAGLFGGPSRSQAERAARVAARRAQLIKEGKLDPEEEPAPPEAEAAPSTRVPPSAPIKDRMAARAERVRRAREEGKL